MPSISISNPESITNLNLGSATPKLGGALKLDRFTSIEVLIANNLDLTGVDGHFSKTTFTSVDLSNNKIIGDLHKFHNSTNCATILLNNNNYDGAGYAVLPTNIEVYRAHNNNLKRYDTLVKIPNFSLYTKLAEYDVSNQSDSFGVSENSSAVNPDSPPDVDKKWGGASDLTNVSTAADSGAIPESIRILDLSNTHISQDSKRILLTQLYDTFEGKGTNWAKTNAVNGVIYSSPRLDVTNDRGVHTGNLLGAHSSVTIADAIDELEDVGFTVNGFN